MCGIAGIYHYAGGSAGAVDRERLDRMHQRLAHRGPDGQDVWFSKEGAVGLAHRRLAIIDPGPSGRQPMKSGFGPHVITYNGEIYNYRALQKLLTGRGYALSTDSDTEVLLGLYHCFGAEMLQYLRGMYALSIWDEERQGLFLARDPYGIKSLYYSRLPGQVRFASEVKALLAAGDIAREKNLVAEANFLLMGSVKEPDTHYRDVRALAAGHSLWIDKHGVSEPQCFCDIASLFQVEAAVGPASEMRAAAAEAFQDTVSHHLVADVPVGAFLSAGVDSGAIASLAAGSLGQPINTVTLGFDAYRHSHDDETIIASEVAGRLGTNHTVRRVDQAEFDHDIDSIFDAMDQPTIDGMNTWFVSKAAAEQGVKVMLSGVGGDELLGGYPSFQDIPRWRRRYGLLSQLPGLGALARALSRTCYALPVSPKAFGLLQYAGDFGGAYLLRRGIFMPWELSTLMGRDRSSAALESLNLTSHFNRYHKGRDQRQGWYQSIATLESCYYLRNQLLRDTDWASMAHSLEVRTPLVDINLSTAVSPLVAASPGKHWLTNAVSQITSQELPASVTQRAKTGFTTPIAKWLMNTKRLDQWRRYPMLRSDHVHWSRRYASCVHQLFFSER